MPGVIIKTPPHTPAARHIPRAAGRELQAYLHLAALVILCGNHRDMREARALGVEMQSDGPQYSAVLVKIKIRRVHRPGVGIKPAIHHHADLAPRLRGGRHLGMKRQVAVDVFRHGHSVNQELCAERRGADLQARHGVVRHGAKSPIDCHSALPRHALQHVKRRGHEHLLPGAVVVWGILEWDLPQVGEIPQAIELLRVAAEHVVLRGVVFLCGVWREEGVHDF